MRWLMLVGMLAACGGQGFGNLVTDITVAPQDPRVLLVTRCELIATDKFDKHQVKVENCGRYYVRRSPIVPIPVAEARVIARDHRVITNLVERPGGGAIVTTCRVDTERTKWKLADCADTEIATAPLEAAETPAPAPPPPAPPPPLP